MKLLLTILILLQFNNDLIAKRMGGKEYSLQSDKPDINKIWLGPNGEYLEISNDSAFFENAWYCWEYPAQITDTSISLKANYFSPADANNGAQQTYSILKHSNDTLVLKASNNEAYETVKTWDPVVFVNKQYFYDSSFDFQQLVFAKQGNNDSDADYMNIQIEVDSAGAIVYSCVPGTGKMNGTYKGNLSESQFRQLKEMLKNSAVEKWNMPHVQFPNAPDYLFRIYNNNKRKVVYGEPLPFIANDVTDFLISSYNEATLEKISDQFGVR